MHEFIRLNVPVIYENVLRERQRELLREIFELPEIDRRGSRIYALELRFAQVKSNYGEVFEALAAFKTYASRNIIEVRNGCDPTQPGFERAVVRGKGPAFIGYTAARQKLDYFVMNLGGSFEASRCLKGVWLSASDEFRVAFKGRAWILRLHPSFALLYPEDPMDRFVQDSRDPAFDPDICDDGALTQFCSDLFTVFAYGEDSAHSRLALMSGSEMSLPPDRIVEQIAEIPKVRGRETGESVLYPEVAASLRFLEPRETR